MLVITDNVNIWIVMLLSAASSAAFAFDMPGRHAILPSVVPARDLFNAVSFMCASMQSAHAIGPLIGPIGIGGVLLTKAALVFASIGAMLPMKPRPAHSVYRESFPTDPPARSTIGAPLAHPDVLVEIDCVATVS